MDRAAIAHAVRAALEPLPFVRALWVGGSASFGREDGWSDIDLGAAVDDGRVDDAFTVVERALESLSPIASRWTINASTHVKPQRMYRLRDETAPLVDVGAMPVSTRPEDRFIERRRHGTPRVLFDRCGFTDDTPPDAAAWRARLAGRVADLESRVSFLGHYAKKSALRGDVAEAVFFYQSFVLFPLVEILRIRHDPWRHDFGVRYLRFDLPEPERSRLFALWTVRDVPDLLAKRDAAEAWFREELRALDVDAIPLD